MLKFIKYSFFDLVRSYWTIIYFLFYAIVSSAILYFSADARRDKALTPVSLLRLDHVLKVYKQGQLIFINGHRDAKVPTTPKAIDYLKAKGVDGGAGDLACGRPGGIV